MTVEEITFNTTGDDEAYKDENYGKGNDILHVNLNGYKALTLIDEILKGIDVLKPSKKSTISFTLFGSLDKQNRT